MAVASMRPQPCGCGNGAHDNYWIFKDLRAYLRAAVQSEHAFNRYNMVLHPKFVDRKSLFIASDPWGPARTPLLARQHRLRPAWPQDA